MSLIRRWSRRRWLAVAAALLGVGTAAAIPGTAWAAPVVTLVYPVTGVTHLNAPDADLALGPGTMSTAVDLATGDLTGDLVLPPATGSFTVLGFVPVTATTQFIPVGQTTGTVARVGGAVTATSRVILRITSLKIGGLPVLVGPACQGVEPATITVNSQPGWSPPTGGTLTGTYTVPPFEHCLLQTAVINLTVPGANNTITLNLATPTAG